MRIFTASAVLVVAACSSTHVTGHGSEKPSPGVDAGSDATTPARTADATAPPAPSALEAGAGTSGPPPPPHTEGAQCGAQYGACNAGLRCLSLATMRCDKNAFVGSPCSEQPLGNCYPEQAVPCLGDGSLCGGFIGPLGSSTAKQTCCAPLGNAGAFSCVLPTQSPACASCSIKGGDDYLEADCQPGHCPVTMRRPVVRRQSRHHLLRR